jgi:hypothetical protein
MNGINIRVGTYPGGLWYDSKPTLDIKPGWGISLALVWGPLWWAIPKLWKKGAYSSKYSAGTIWLIVKLPFFVGPLLAVAAGNWGFYIGFKQNGWGDNSFILPTMRVTRSRKI